MAVSRKPATVNISVDEGGNITVSPTSLVVKVGQPVEWAAPGFKAMLLVFYEGNPIDAPVLRSKGGAKAAGRARNRGIYHYQVVVAKVGPGGVESDLCLYADTGCPTIIIQ